MFSASGIYTVHREESRTILGFERGLVPNHFYHQECQSDLLDLATEGKPLILDLSSIHHLPSGLLGLLASLRTQGVDVRVSNVPDCIRTAAEVAGLIEMLAPSEPATPLPAPAAST